MGATGDFSWWNIVPTLVGGVLSTTSAVGMFVLAQRQDRKKRAAERKSLAAMLAYAGLMKLMKTGNSLIVLARHIDQQFDEAREEGRIEEEPASIVKPILGAPVTIEDVTAEEAGFLAKTDAELISLIWEIQQRARNNDLMVETYNKFRQEYDLFLESKADGIKEIEGSVASYSLSGNDAKIAHMRIGKLNQIIVPLIAALDEDRKSIVTVIERYVAVAVESFGDDFPAKKIEWKDLGKC